MRAIHWPIFALAVAISLWIVRKVWRRAATPNDRRAWVLVVTCAYFALVLTLLEPLPRYAVPLRPVVYVLAVLALCRLADFLRPRFRARQPAVA
jgi:hypothetical protein